MTGPRLTRLTAVLRDRGIDALLVSALPNVRYLTGFSGSNGVCIAAPGRRAVLITDPRYELQSAAEAPAARRIISADGLPAGALRGGALRGVRRAGVEAAALTVAGLAAWRKAFPRVRFVPVEGLVEGLMAVKEPVEIARIRKAIAISEEVYNAVLPLLRPGVRELDIAAEITYRQRRAGADRDAFEPIVASGPRGALPHARATSRRLRKGELVTLDFGCTVGGYPSDITRTVGIGRVPDRLRRIHATVLRAQTAAIAAARAGITARELDAVARSLITEAGFGARFRHGLGHGLGLVLHERPLLSPRNSEILRAGMVVTIEPGIYIPRVGGVRIEDDILLHDRGCRILTSITNELVQL